LYGTEKKHIFAQKRKSDRFGMTWGWVHDDRHLIFG